MSSAAYTGASSIFPQINAMSASNRPQAYQMPDSYPTSMPATTVPAASVNHVFSWESSLNGNAMPAADDLDFNKLDPIRADSTSAKALLASSKTYVPQSSASFPTSKPPNTAATTSAENFSYEDFLDDHAWPGTSTELNFDNLPASMPASSIAANAMPADTTDFNNSEPGFKASAPDLSNFDSGVDAFDAGFDFDAPLSSFSFPVPNLSQMPAQQKFNQTPAKQTSNQMPAKQYSSSPACQSGHQLPSPPKSSPSNNSNTPTRDKSQANQQEILRLKAQVASLAKENAQIKDGNAQYKQENAQLKTNLNTANNMCQHLRNQFPVYKQRLQAHYQGQLNHTKEQLDRTKEQFSQFQAQSHQFQVQSQAQIDQFNVKIAKQNHQLSTAITLANTAIKENQLLKQQRAQPSQPAQQQAKQQQTASPPQTPPEPIVIEDDQQQQTNSSPPPSQPQPEQRPKLSPVIPRCRNKRPDWLAEKPLGAMSGAPPTAEVKAPEVKKRKAGGEAAAPRPKKQKPLKDKEYNVAAEKDGLVLIDGIGWHTGAGVFVRAQEREERVMEKESELEEEEAAEQGVSDEDMFAEMWSEGGEEEDREGEQETVGSPVSEEARNNPFLLDEEEGEMSDLEIEE